MYVDNVPTMVSQLDEKRRLFMLCASRIVVVSDVQATEPLHSPSVPSLDTAIWRPGRHMSSDQGVQCLT